MQQFTAIQDFPDYQIGDLGTVKSLKYGKERVLRPRKDKDGYLVVNLYLKQLQKTVKVHRMVALHWVDNPNPELYDQVNHLDGDKMNCAKSNLAWTDQKGNNEHAFATGLKVGNIGTKHPNAKLTPEQVQEIRNLKGQKSCREIGLMFGICRSHVSKIQSLGKWKPYPELEKLFRHLVVEETKAGEATVDYPEGSWPEREAQQYFLGMFAGRVDSLARALHCVGYSPEAVKHIRREATKEHLKTQKEH